MLIYSSCYPFTFKTLIRQSQASNWLTSANGYFFSLKVKAIQQMQICFWHHVEIFLQA